MLRRLIKKHKHIEFAVIYTREPHARQMAYKDIGQPLNWEERRAMARMTKKEMNLDALFLIDEMGDPSRKLFGDVPNPAIFVQPDGTIRDKLSWADASEVNRIIAGWPAILGTQLPGMKLRDRNGKAIELSGRRKKPLVLIGGAYTSSQSRQRAAALQSAIKTAGHLDFIFVVTGAPKAAQGASKGIAKRKTWNERQTLAKLMKSKLGLNIPFLVDEMTDSTRPIFGDVSDPTLFIEKDGTIRHLLSWTDGPAVSRVLKSWNAPQLSKASQPKK